MALPRRRPSGRVFRPVFRIPLGVARQIRLVRRSPPEVMLARLLLSQKLVRLRRDAS